MAAYNHTIYYFMINNIILLFVLEAFIYSLKTINIDYSQNYHDLRSLWLEWWMHEKNEIIAAMHGEVTPLSS